jgi:hypothetical protein
MGREDVGIWLTDTTNDILDKQIRRKDFECFECERAHNSAVECHLHTVEVVGSNPAVPTNPFNNLG